MILFIFVYSKQQSPNATIGEVRNSNHLTGRAVDLHLLRNEVAANGSTGSWTTLVLTNSYRKSPAISVIEFTSSSVKQATD